MSVFDRFRKLERARRESAQDALPPQDSLERFRPPPPELDPDARPLAKPCAKCGAQNGALDTRCAHCDAELDGEEMRAHQEMVRAREREAAERAAAERDRKLQEAERLLERERARRARRESAQAPAGSTTGGGAGALDWSQPLLALLQSTRAIEPYALRLGMQIALVLGFVAALFWALSDIRRYPLLVLILLAVGIHPGRRRRWWR